LVYYWGEEKIGIGCKVFSIQEWKENFKEVGESEGYTVAQIEEYHSYILLVENFHNANNQK
jgi:hypothetical protein